MTKSSTRNVKNQSQISLSDQRNIEKEIREMRYDKSRTTVNKNVAEI